jgi:uncharacterized HAD superfamily protein
VDESELDANKNSLDDEEIDMENYFEKTFGWFIVLNRISQDDITKHSEIIKKTIIEVLNQLSYQIEKDKKLERLHKKAMERR